MKAFNAIIQTTNGTYHVDLKTINGYPLFNVTYNNEDNDSCNFSLLEQALKWVNEHSDYHSNPAAAENDDGISDEEYFAQYDYECNPD